MTPALIIISATIYLSSLYITIVTDSEGTRIAALVAAIGSGLILGSYAL